LGYPGRPARDVRLAGLERDEREDETLMGMTE